MIKAMIVLNTSGKVRFTRFYEKATMASLLLQQQLAQHLYQAVSARGKDMCFFVDGFDLWPTPDTRVVYRHYATIVIIFVTDRSESQLAMLDFTQVFVEVLDRVFKNVCELDFFFHTETIHRVLMEMILGGMVVDMSKESIVRQVTAAEAASTGGGMRGTSHHYTSGGEGGDSGTARWDGTAVLNNALTYIWGKKS